MFKLLKNKKGASLIEIVATITITSIALMMIYNILSFNIRQNGINHEKTLNANIANGTLSYIKNQDFIIINDYLSNNTENYVEINDNSCNTLFSYDLDTCLAVLSPIINNRRYDSENLYVYILPFNDPVKLDSVIASPPPGSPDIFINYLNNIDTTKYSQANVNEHAVRVIVVVESSINKRFDYLLEGVSTDE